MKFASAEEAIRYIQTYGLPDDMKLDPEDEKKSQTKSADGLHDVSVPDGPYAFVDGSFNSETGVYGYGGFLDVNGRRYPLRGRGDRADMASMRNVAGEISGSMAAVKKAEELGLSHITMLYDYKGIEEWAEGRWKTNKICTAEYKQFMQDPSRTVLVSFQKVEGHTGVRGNEMADVMAKSAVGIHLNKKQSELLDQALSMGDRSGIPGMDVSDMTEKSDEDQYA